MMIKTNNRIPVLGAFYLTEKLPVSMSDVVVFFFLQEDRLKRYFQLDWREEQS